MGQKERVILARGITETSYKKRDVSRDLRGIG